MPKGIPNKRYTPEFKKIVIETMLGEKLSYSETARRFEVSGHHCIQDWERIYLTEGAEGFAVERRGQGVKDVHGNCRKKRKRICWQRYRDFVRRMTT